MTGRMAGLVLLALAMAATPAAAQEVVAKSVTKSMPESAPVSEASITACLDSASNRTSAQACIGRLAGACQEGGAGTTLSITDCLAAETRVWDGLLNALWPEVVALARSQDAGRGNGTPASEDRLRAAQRAWIGFRDAECGWAWQRWSEGTIRSIVAGDCQMRRTAERVLDFRAWLAGG